MKAGGGCLHGRRPGWPGGWCRGPGNAGRLGWLVRGRRWTRDKGKGWQQQRLPPAPVGSQWMQSVGNGCGAPGALSEHAQLSFLSHPYPCTSTRSHWQGEIEIPLAAPNSFTNNTSHVLCKQGLPYHLAPPLPAPLHTAYPNTMPPIPPARTSRATHLFTSSKHVMPPHHCATLLNPELLMTRQRAPASMRKSCGGARMCACLGGVSEAQVGPHAHTTLSMQHAGRSEVRAAGAHGWALHGRDPGHPTNNLPQRY